MNTPKNYQILLAIFCFFMIDVAAQDGEYYPTPGTPTPSTAKGATTSVNEFTGAVSVSVPLFSIQSESYTLPISLNYSSQGARVSQIASWAGMGWNLNAGGVITRQVNGLPDDAHNFTGDGYLYNGQIVNDIYNKSFGGLSSSEKDYMFKYGKDAEPDIFHFNIGGGISGKFFFDKNGEPQLESQADLKIEYDLDQNYSYTSDHSFLTSNYRGLIKNFTITTPSGHIFKFEDRSYSISNEEDQYDSKDDGTEYISSNCYPQLEDPYRVDFSGVNAVVTAWHLTSITNPYYDENDNPLQPEIILEYTDEIYLNHSNIYQWQAEGCIGISPTITHTSSNVESYLSKRLDKITYGNGSINYGQIDFTSTFDRDDIHQYTQYPPFGYQHPKALSTIQHKSGSQIVKKYSFTYDWASQLSTSCSYPPPFMDAHKKRLQLSSIQEKNNGLVLPAYEFTYNTTPMPPRHSSQVDIWGYYNGTNQNSHFRPTMYAYSGDAANNDAFKTIFSPFQRSSYSGSEYVLSGSDRNSDFAYAQAGILEAIASPLGSTTDIVYESNSFLFLGGTETRGGLRVKSITENDGNGNATSTSYYYDSNEDGTGQTTGRLLEMPLFSVLRNPEICIHLGWLNQLLTSSSDRMSLGGTPSIGYSKISKEVGHGKIVTEYNIPVKYGTPSHDNGVYTQSVSDRASPPITVDNFPCPPNPNYSWRNGLPSTQKVYDDNGNLISKTEYEYELLDHEKIKAIRSVYTESTPNPDRYEWGKYYFISAFHRPVKKTTTNYDELGNTLTTETHYEYNSPHHRMVTASYTDNSDGLRHRMEYYYPQDEGINTLIDSWRIGSPVRTLLKVGAPGNLQTVDGQKIDYGNFIISSSYDIYAPEEIYRWGKEAGQWLLEKTHVNYSRTGLLNRYDSPGNPQTVLSIVNGQVLWKTFNTSWKWDYTYHPDRMLSTVTEPDDQVTSYSYDNLNRLQSISERGGDRVEQYDYTLQLGAGGDNKTRTTYAYAGLSNIPPISEYYDGLGRNITTRLESYTPSGTDYITSRQYDANGRMTQACDPSSGGCTYYYYEDNPLNRLKEQKAPGWPRKPRTKYLVNTTADNVKKVLGTQPTYYPAGSLFKYEYRDENYNYGYEFKDKLGRTVLKRRKLNASQFADTYYKYDEKGNLTYVIPPGAESESSTLAYKYEYNDNDLVKKKDIPGSGSYEYEYYANDLLKKETDPNGNITEYFYNAFNQPKYVKDGAGNMLKEYDYFSATSGINVGKLKDVYTKVLGTSTMLHTEYTYDQYGRVETEIADNYLGGKDEYVYDYDMADRTVLVERDHYESSSSGTPDKEVDKRYEYDNSGRLEGVYMSVDGGTEVQLSEQHYDAKDRLIEKNLGVTTGNELQSIDYAYNSRSWLTKINDIFYTLVGQTPCDNEISFMMAGGESASYDQEPQIKGTIAFTYDKRAIARRYASSIDLHFNLEGVIGELPLAPYSESFTIDVEGEQGSGPAALETKTLEIEGGLLTFEDVAAVAALSIKEDIQQAMGEDAYGREDAYLLEQNLYQGMQAAAAGPQPPPPNTAPENDLFSENIYYNTSNSDLNAAPQYNGNISYLYWRVGSRVAQSYGFTYDKLDRLTDARFAEYDYEQECDEYFNFGRYDVSLAYEDHRGNISSISRQGLVSGAGTFGQIDQIAITNDASNNRIESLTESSLQSKGFKGSSGQMGYDSNGNLTSDPSRGITITNYNRLNLPEQITVSNSSFNGSITFTYDFDGNLLKREVSQSSPTALSLTTEYVSGMEYVDGSLQSIYHEEGRYVKSGANWHREYVIRDHLGNNRVYFSDTNGDGFVSMSEVSQEAHYYPFGMAMEGSWLSSPLPENKYRYNGIEQTASLGLDVYNAFYRTLDPSLGRWWQVDPKAELHYGDSPYNSMLNNPVLYDDPNGDTPLHLGAAIVGGLFNLGSQFLKGNVTSWGEGLGYFGVGAAAGALYVTPGGQAAGGTLQTIGNKSIQIATGKFDVTEINSVRDVANLALDIGGDYLLVEAGAKIGSNIAVGLKSLVSSYAPSVASGGGAIVKTGVGGTVADITFSISLSDEVVVTASKVGGKGLAAKGATGFADDAIRLTTSSKSQAPSRTYTIFDGSGQLYKFGVTNANLARYGQSLRQAGPGAYGKLSSIMPKNRAHIMEKYLRSLHYNSTGQYALPGMKIPYPVNFNTGLPFRP